VVYLILGVCDAGWLRRRLLHLGRRFHFASPTSSSIELAVFFFKEPNDVRFRAKGIMEIQK
jgi:hypothetical protein